MNTEPILILGASSWVGHYLVPEINRQVPRVPVIAAYAHNTPSFKGEVDTIQCSSDQFDKLRRLRFSTLVNLSRGETPTDFNFHLELIELMNQRGGRYVYASSSNAVDQDISRAHVESDPPGSQCEYGQFKARCEVALSQKSKHWAAFRFSATHGWAPNRIARTEEFLQRLSRGETLVVPRGIVQNRTFVGELALQISRIVLEPKADGIFHLGTSDFSEEIDFLRRLGRAFGYSTDLIVEGEKMECNLVTVVDQLSKLFPDYMLPTEEDTLMQVQAQAELATYVNRFGASV